MGIREEDLSTKNRFHKQISAKEGVIISEINRHAYLSRIGADLGDVIRKIDDIPVKNTSDFKKAIVKHRNKAAGILLQRGEHGYYITVKLS